MSEETISNSRVDEYFSYLCRNYTDTLREYLERRHSIEAHLEDTKKSFDAAKEMKEGHNVLIDDFDGASTGKDRTRARSYIKESKRNRILGMILLPVALVLAGFLIFEKIHGADQNTLLWLTAGMLFSLMSLVTLWARTPISFTRKMWPTIGVIEKNIGEDERQQEAYKKLLKNARGNWPELSGRQVFFDKTLDSLQEGELLPLDSPFELSPEDSLNYSLMMGGEEPEEEKGGSTVFDYYALKNFADENKGDLGDELHEEIVGIFQLLNTRVVLNKEH